MAKARTSRSNSRKNGDSAQLQATTDAMKAVVPINLEDEIRRRAYQIYEERGCTPGDEHEDWLRAEREVLARYQQTA
jgi:Protein of unknown function (DUF2934)